MQATKKSFSILKVDKTLQIIDAKRIKGGISDEDAMGNQMRPRTG